MARAVRLSLVLLVAAAAVTLALMLTGALGGAGPSAAGAATKAHAARVHHKAKHHRAPARARGAQSTQAGEGNENAGESESAAEGNEPAGEAQPGHEDSQGQQVDHQCPPGCAPGEQP